MNTVISTPGTTPARNSWPTDRLMIEAMSRNTIEGGMIGPTVAAQAMTAQAKSSGKRRFFISGTPGGTVS